MLRSMIVLCITLAMAFALTASAGASGPPSERCQAVSDTMWYQEGVTHRTVMHEIVKLDLCFVPGGWFTQIQPGSVSVLDLTCGSLCTFPYVTSVHSAPALQTTNLGTRASVTTQFKVDVCPLFVGPSCTFSTYLTLTTHFCLNGAGQGSQPATGTATMYVWKCGSDYRKGI